MDFKEVFSRVTPRGWLTEGEAKVLWDYAHGRILEVGSYCGRSTYLLAHRGEVISVDPFDNFDTGDMTGDGIYKEFLENTKDLPVTNYKMKIEEWKPEPVDFAFLDGDHTYQGTRDQIIAAIACHPEYIAIHDYSNSAGGVLIMNACDDILGKPDFVVETLALWKKR